ncbi:OmpA family protein [Lentisalinibacter orientalis]|uniref:OmpA family protein n=1 Tax=Lentisalinibacter orientalis TaxID=2992241 RepID=UPI00386CAC36
MPHSMTRLASPLLCLLALVAMAATAGAQELRATLFEDADAAREAAEQAQASVLSPRNWDRGLKAYETAEEGLERGRNVDYIRGKLAEAEEAFGKAAEAAELARITLATVIETRKDAREAEAPARSAPIWEDAERKFADAIRELESGDLRDARERAEEAESLYRDAELSAIKSRYLSETRRLLEEADRARVERYAPITLARSRRLLQQAEKELNENRYDTDLPRSLARQANYEARHAIRLADVVRDVRDDDMTVEELILSWERALTAVAGAADIVPDLVDGNEELTAELVAYVENLRSRNQSLEQDLADSVSRVAEMEEELRILDERLGGATEERRELMERLQAQNRIREQFAQVEKMFERDEAQVFREGNDVTLRLVGLSFPSGSASLEAEHYPLMEKVEAAINVFPRSQLTVEGHTDSYGGDESNVRLSQARAEAVMQYMINALRVPSYRLSATGYGETRPIASNETADGRARNRRIDIVISPELDDM